MEIQRHGVTITLTFEEAQQLAAMAERLIADCARGVRPSIDMDWLYTLMSVGIPNNTMPNEANFPHRDARRD